SLSLTIPWVPQAKERPRFNRKTGRAYTPTNTKLAERELREEFLARRPDGFEPFDGPIAVSAFFDDEFIRLVVKEADEPTSKKLRADLDNYLKLFDALNGTCWVDDKQIVDLRGVKL